MAITVSFLEIPPKVNLQGHPCLVTVTSNLSSVTDIYIHLRIQELINGVWTDTQKEDALPLVDGAAVFDISGYFKDVFTPAFSYPEHITNLIIPRNTLVKSFRVRVWESYQDASGTLLSKDSESLQIPETSYMLPGGISDDNAAALNEISATWWDKHVLSGRALNWLPGQKTIAPDSIEKIYWIQPNTMNRTLRFDYVTISGDEGFYEYTQIVTAYIPHELSVSPGLLEKMVGQPIDRYSVSLVGTMLSQDYRIDRDNYEWSEHFIMTNSFFCYESLWCRGARAGKVNYERQRFQKNNRKFLRYTDRTSGTIRKTFSKSQSSNTGFIADNSDLWIDWITDLLNSDDVYCFRSGKVLPATILAESIEIEDQLSLEPRSISFDWEYSRKGSFYSNLEVTVNKVYPPYYYKLSAFFQYVQAATIVDLVNRYKAIVRGVQVTFPEIPGNDLFDFSDAAYWDQSVINNSSWFDPNNPRICPLSFMKGWNWSEAGTSFTHARLYHRDYNNNPRDLLPILIYNKDLNKEEQQVVIEWLDWYYTIFEDSAVIIENDNTIIE